VDVRWQQPCFTWPIASLLSVRCGAPRRHASRIGWYTIF